VGCRRGYDLILVDSGEAEVVRAATARAAEAVVARFGTGQFAGELSLLARQATYLSSPISKPRCTAAAILRPSPCTPQRRATTHPTATSHAGPVLLCRRHPATGWLEDIAVDDDGFVLTGTQLDGALPGATLG
jgi:hypothetical protein